MGVASIDSRALAVLALVTSAGCGRSPPPGEFVGESEHFRLFVDPEVEVPAGLEGENGLVALETEWADVHTMLQMPEGKKITYYWVSYDHLAAACGESDEGACVWEQSLEIDSPTLPNAHELNHAYMYLRKQRKPIPFLAEGIAEAIACGTDIPLNLAPLPWPGVVAAQDTSDDVYVQGGAFVRYLIRTYGVAKFLSYYEQSPEQRDPAAFGANFQSFWHTTLDDVWNAMNVALGPSSEGDTKICPCSLPALDPSGAVANDPARAPYWTLPDPGAETFAFSAGLEAIAVKDCAGIRAPLVGEQVLARLGGAEPRYVLSPVGRATLGSYLADTCAGTAPYPISPPLSFGNDVVLGVASPKTVTVYLDLASTFSGVLWEGLEQVCDTCAFDQGTCQPIAAEATPVVQGPVYARTTLRQYPGQPTDVVWNYFAFYP
jgi:hypothetical protein